MSSTPDEPTDTADNPVYDNPWAYDLACAFRDVRAEVDALLGWYARSGPSRRGLPGSVLELAAGPAEHAREFARRGIPATALDLSPAMCAYAEERAKADGVALEVVRADMARFELGRGFDLIVTMLDSTAHLMTLDAFVAHLDRVAGHLTAGGCYVLEMSHPADRLTDEPSTGTVWTVERDGVRADVRWGEPGDRLDPITQVVREHVTIAVAREGGSEVIRGVVPYRFWTATELTAAVRLSGALRVVAQYGDFTGIGPGDPDAWRLITVFRPAS
ncbi:Methyltransferase domain-containing protein [Thermomonospora echinospora]|uniref:Methyltransferase domain-containing protein n=1 Tax=Thermomonospora echinospora TaxID=1992 RepID=A0A1H6BW56_9ACTN|nr:class I SAM-dependent methyltransferase [Thermomonospora echinospora]SEG64938.1 Methyltransferase domain-containing protein [Thermomonospora echinospora]